MAYNYYHSAKLGEAHRQDLLREAAQQRLLARLPLSRRTISALLSGSLK
jgi:hypothetical protein